jgi:hypothetical protein
VDGLLEEGFTSKLVDCYWAKGTAIMVCQDQETSDWLAARVPTLAAWEGSRLKMVGLDALPTYKSCGLVSRPRGGQRCISSGSRLNQGLNARNWRVYECKELNGVHLVLSIDSVCHCTGGGEVEDLQWGGTGYLLPSGC